MFAFPPQTAKCARTHLGGRRGAGRGPDVQWVLELRTDRRAGLSANQRTWCGVCVRGAALFLQVCDQRNIEFGLRSILSLKTLFFSKA